MTADRAASLREEILNLVREYHQAQWGQAGEFVPGVTRVPYGGRVFDAAELETLVDAALDFWLTYGRYSERFETDFARWLGRRHCLLVNSGSSANLLAFAALCSPRLGERRLRPGDEVITVAAGFPTTVAPIVQHGARPVFCDVDPATADIAVSALEGAVSSRTRAVFLAHTLGNPFDVAAVLAFCRAHELWLIEDNCDALGSVYEGRLTGTFGDIATSSFYPPHHMTLGEGGAVYTDDDLLAEILGSLRDWGRDCRCPSGVDNRCGARFAGAHGDLPLGYDHKYVYSHLGYNLRATDLQAAIGCAQLEKLPEFVRRRRANHATLSRLLASLGDLLEIQRATPRAEPSWFGLLLTLSGEAKAAGLTRAALVAALEDAQVQTRMLFAGNMVRQPCIVGLGSSASPAAADDAYRVVGDLVNTDRLMSDAFWIGVYPGLTDDMLGHMARVLLEACGR